MPDYTHVRSGYLQWYTHLLSPLDLNHGAEDPLDQIEHRADGLSFSSEELTQATRPYLTSSVDASRMAAVNSLLQQLEGDLEAASYLWAILDSMDDDPSDDAVLGAIADAMHGSRIADTHRRLHAELPINLHGGKASQEPASKVGAIYRPQALDEALEDLRFEIYDTTELITDRVSSTGLRLIRDMLNVGDTEWQAVLKGIDLLRGQEKAGDIGWGLEDSVPIAASGIAASLRNTLINVIDKVLIIIEKNDLVRYTISDWLTDLRANTQTLAERKAHFNGLLDQLFQSEHFLEEELDVWLGDAARVDHLHAAADDIMHLADNFDQFANQVRRLGALLSASRFLKHPLLMSGGFAIHVGLLSTLVFAGYDHIDEGSRALNITRGIKEILISDVPVSAMTLQFTDNTIAYNRRKKRKQVSRFGRVGQKGVSQ